MKYAIIIEEGRERRAILKTEDDSRANALAILCKHHLAAVLPGTRALVSADRAHYTHIDMHPDWRSILDQLRAAETPLPMADLIIEGEFERI